MRSRKLRRPIIFRVFPLVTPLGCCARVRDAVMATPGGDPSPLSAQTYAAGEEPFMGPTRQAGARTVADGQQAGDPPRARRGGAPSVVRELLGRAGRGWRCRGSLPFQKERSL